MDDASASTFTSIPLAITCTSAFLSTVCTSTFAVSIFGVAQGGDWLVVFRYLLSRVNIMALPTDDELANLITIVSVMEFVGIPGDFATEGSEQKALLRLLGATPDTLADDIAYLSRHEVALVINEWYLGKEHATLVQRGRAFRMYEICARRRWLSALPTSRKRKRPEDCL